MLLKPAKLMQLTNPHLGHQMAGQMQPGMAGQWKPGTSCSGAKTKPKKKRKPRETEVAARWKLTKETKKEERHQHPSFSQKDLIRGFWFAADRSVESFAEAKRDIAGMT